ncbi:aryl-alcohol dehydrogenase-like predicted oxidoreductase [Kribbella orskensis]|uniref:Aryl-alcohol dehydrogenase-like predicted oxidoreductase n=1 Tax=Kribbella orskensis TaxID=2512216 RepID=A0ABY2BSP8_9ACTN|nr:MULTISPECIES: aldo/keto reductase [Kribbella]TCN42724.1 aryl-alcohol dehydrogenase-like predicted oxidoreductase [Kribbella sp. VKM Ac-2500]TCO29920.1 aryl-alcohol dehydrogenase-like predicted oxidoreductase [Kribbella orskensis]
MTKTPDRSLGTDGPTVSALGMGCWAIGGPHARQGSPVGWGVIDDDESKQALRRAFDLGVTFYDTADVYGCGHSEKLIAAALGDMRDQIVIASKAGYTYDEETREAPGENGDPEYIRWACEQSLRRLGTDHLDLYQFHLGGFDLDRVDDVLAVFEELVAAGKVRAIGWSTDSPERAALFAKSEHCKAIQQSFNVFGGNVDVLELCEQRGLASIVRGPLGMGLLTGKFDQDSTLPADDVRHGWDFRTGNQAASLRRLDAIRDVLTTDGRTLAQGALAWLWARSPAFIPIPGFKTVAQVEENAAALDHGPLTPESLTQITTILSKS